MRPLIQTPKYATWRATWSCGFTPTLPTSVNPRLAHVQEVSSTSASFQTIRSISHPPPGQRCHSRYVQDHWCHNVFGTRGWDRHCLHQHPRSRANLHHTRRAGTPTGSYTNPTQQQMRRRYHQRHHAEKTIEINGCNFTGWRIGRPKNASMFFGRRARLT